MVLNLEIFIKSKGVVLHPSTLIRNYFLDTRDSILISKIHLEPGPSNHPF